MTRIESPVVRVAASPAKVSQDFQDWNTFGELLAAGPVSDFKAEGDNLYTLFKKISVGRFEDLPAHYSPQLRRLVASMIQIDPTARPETLSLGDWSRLAAQAR